MKALIFWKLHFFISITIELYKLIIKEKDTFATEGTDFVMVHCDLIKPNFDSFNQADVVINTNLIILVFSICSGACIPFACVYIGSTAISANICQAWVHTISVAEV